MALIFFLISVSSTDHSASVRSHDPESYAGGSLATDRVFHARQDKGDDPDKKWYPGPPGWGR
jgi:predicted 2-oxoglutarate/Fe(II)-dependent dioxygenase YbiX